jgi:hypothetical protein
MQTAEVSIMNSGAGHVRFWMFALSCSLHILPIPNLSLAFPVPTRPRVGGTMIDKLTRVSKTRDSEGQRAGQRGQRGHADSGVTPRLCTLSRKVHSFGLTPLLPPIDAKI